MGIDSNRGRSEALEIRVPADPEFAAGVEFVRDLSLVEPSDLIVIDFSAVQFVTPAWLMVVAGGLRALRKRFPQAKRRAVNFRHLGYAAHMGFFNHFGVNFGQLQGGIGSDTYVPFSERLVEDVRRQAGLTMVPVGELLHADAERLAMMMSREQEGNLQDTLAYSIREIIRNSVEHSDAESYTFAAQFWPSRGEVELVVCDHGVGLCASLRENPSLEIADDAQALEYAIQPGVSSKAWRRSRHDDEWANSGYGLFMTERLCRLGGSFELLSGTSLLRIAGDNKRIAAASWDGTLAVLRMSVSNLNRLTDTLLELRAEGARLEREARGKVTGPSKASQSAKPQNWTGS